MNDQTIKDNIDSLLYQLFDLVDCTLGKALLEEIEDCRKLNESFDERYTIHGKKSIEKIEQNSVAGLLFESVDITFDIKEILDNYIQELNLKIFEQELINLNTEVIKLLNIEIKTSENKTSGKLSDNFKATFRNALNIVLQKKTTNNNVTECYQYFHLVFDVLQSHIERINDFEEKRLNILSKLWDKSKITDSNITILSKHNYKLEVSKSDFRLELNFNETEKLLEDLSQEAEIYIKTLKDAIKSAFENFENNKLHHKNIIEKNRKKYNPEHVAKASKTLEKTFNHSRGKWQNTILALSDDWCLELEISLLKFHILKGYFNFVNHVDNKLKNPLDEKVNYMKGFTGELRDMFKPADNLLPDHIIEIVKKGKIEFHRKLKRTILPEIKNVLINGDLPNVVDDFEKDTAIQFETLSKSRLLIKDPIYDHPIDRSEMYKISPHALVSFDMQPEFMKVFPALKNAIVRQLQVLQVKLEEIPEIVEFSIESALGYYETKQDLNESLKVGNEGIKRAINKIDDLVELRKDFYNSEIDLLKDKIDKLIVDISEITDNESALQIKIRITKAKAIEQSKAVREKIISNIKNFLPRIILKIQTFNKYLIESSIKIRKQFEGEVTKTFITSDVSDYLVETEEAVSRLPFVYQRLFKLEPLSTFDLYIDRPKAHEKFKLAYTRWKSGKFAPTVIIGEKGSGKTSLVNRFLSSKSINEKVIFHDLHKEYLEPEVAYNNILESINELLAIQKEEESAKSKRIVVIDGLERLFEARINGFNVLQKTIQLISKTNSQIFWVVACHLYSYKYLVKSFNISEYFGYHIELEDLSAEDLVKIIERRHNISGFRLKFLPDVQRKSIMPSIKQVDKNDQMELRAVYFDRLQKIVSGNITQAFLYWMRSAAEVTEDVIYITQTDTKLDFIRSISLSKFEILKNILIHNGISSSKHSELFRIPFEKSELQLEQMLDDGIIIKQSEFYNINPMIYKQVIERMFILNLLH